MKSSEFDYDQYKNYLNDRLLELSKLRSGQRSRLARAVSCQSAYISQVLGGSANFSLEQGEKINLFLNHSEEEALYFLTLIQLERVGTSGLRGIFKKQLQALLEKRLDLKQRLSFQQTLQPEDQVTYYSSWHYAAIHVLASLPELNTLEQLAQSVRVTPSRVADVLDFLCNVGLLQEKNGEYSVGVSRIHLGKDSPNIVKHHTNWRLRAIDSLERPTERNLHYSSVATMSSNDADIARKILIEAVEKIRTLIKESKDEGGYCYNLDFFPLLNV